MKVLFIDEVSFSQKAPTFLGIGVLEIDITRYKQLKQDFWKAFKEMAWAENIEFKGKFMFSSRKGDKSVSVDKRLSFVESLVQSSVSEKNARYHFTFFYNFRGIHLDNFLELLVQGLGKAIKKCSKKKNGKDIYMIVLDSRDDINPEEVFKVVEPVIRNKGCILFERPFIVKSSNYTPGIITVDILSYISSWFILNDTTPSLFEYARGQMARSKHIEEKLKRIRQLLEKVKNKRFIRLD